MNRIVKILLLTFVLLGFTIPGEDEEMIKNIFNASLTQGRSYENLRSLCKDVGNRLTGSKGDTLAVLWAQSKLEDMGCENVTRQPFDAPYWKRNGRATGSVVSDGKVTEISVLALGSSVNTGKKGVKAQVVEIETWSELEQLGTKVKGKIVFYNRPMSPKNVNTFMSYGETVDQRSKGAVEAAKLGAVASLVRSVTLSNDDHPHTGNMNYETGILKIPGLAVSAKDAGFLHDELKKNPSLEVELHAGCENLGIVQSNNVFGEIRGTEFPDEIIVIGGHLDSWDVGEGAHDDGAGIVHAMEVLNIFKQIGYKPKRTIRVVCFMNEENGVAGGNTYAKIAAEKGEKHIAAIESDAGAFSPRGFHIEGNEDIQEKAYQNLMRWSKLLAPYNLHYFEKGYAGTDIRPLKSSGTVCFGLIPDSQRYFDFHHTEADVFEAVHRRELELGCASIASLVYLIDKNGIN